MKKTLTLLFAAAGFAAATEYEYTDWNGSFTMDRSGAPFFTLEDSDAPFSITLINLDSVPNYSNQNKFEPNKDIGKGGSYTFSMAVKNTSDEAIELSSITLGVYLFRFTSAPKEIILTGTRGYRGTETITIDSTTGTTDLLIDFDHSPIMIDAKETWRFNFEIKSSATSSVYLGLSSGTFTTRTEVVSGDDNIPEPTTATLSLLALAGLAARRRRR